MLEEMLETIRQAKVAQLLLSTVSTFASVAYGKLETGELAEAKRGNRRDRRAPAAPEGRGRRGDPARLRAALANLKLAYADAVASAE